MDTDRLMLIVTGSHLRSEIGDRPLAYRLRERICAWQEEHPGSGFEVVVCSDMWYLNNDELRSLPTVSIGGPGVNALSAYLGDKLSSVFVIEDVLMVQADLDFDDLVVCCWGIDHGATVSAVDAFCEKYLEQFLEAAAERVAGA